MKKITTFILLALLITNTACTHRFSRLHSHNALLINTATGEVLLYQNATEQMYPASLVKILTALVAIENLPSLTELITLDESIFQKTTSANAAIAGFWPNERVQAIDLLYGLLLPSGAECALALAQHIAGTEADFVNIMNQRAIAIGLTNSHFTNTTGLHHPNQYTTAQDMATLLQYALGNPIFYQIITSPHHATAGTNLRPGGITFRSTLFSRMATTTVTNGDILGGRTGFTSQAGQNLASFAIINGTKYILVTAGAQTNGQHLSLALHIEDALTIFNQLERLLP